LSVRILANLINFSNLKNFSFKFNFYLHFLDSSIDRSLSFGYSANLNDDSLAKDDTSSTKPSSPKKQHDTSSIKLKKNNNNNTDLNYTSIEKLDILKPQSKDYILCFDTSSIEQNSSCASDSENPTQGHSASKKNCSIEISEALSSNAESLKQQTTECSDSGLDTARSPLSNSHDTVLEDCECSSDNSDKIAD